MGAASVTLHLGDCRDVLPTLLDASVGLIIADPPYWSTGKAEVGDRQWSSATDYLAWLDTVLVQWHRLLQPNGSLYCFAAPDMAARVEMAISTRFNVLNHIAWRKGAGWHQKAEEEALRGYFPATERIIFAEHHNSDNTAMGAAGYEARCDELRGFVFEPLRAYFDAERIRCGISNQAIMDGMAARTGVRYTFAHHTFSRSQWELPTQAQYEAARDLFNTFATGGDYLRREYDYLRREYEDLRREYEDLRREYEDLRRPFFATADAPYTDVWDFPTVGTYPGKHGAEKPLAMLEHMVAISSRPDMLVLDPFLGSGVCGVAAVGQGRSFIGIEIDPAYYAIAERRIEQSTYESRYGIRYRKDKVIDGQGRLFDQAVG